ncbi:Putative SOS response-associated peptidase YedK [Sphingomonas laterariae]|uniref:Putative SOS response-associated peptidase YedK n=1 Tax=Edaphosphingomonas laterariae TaxID=861865 RepID=A0A239KTA9_9SPHN|nr:SOS response-associated peptidase family protein [Sphingomonas laterariae]SNT20843.1 Putative SOS response-associated peptidase YedK [Sphingomonas laterariae]
MSRLHTVRSNVADLGKHFGAEASPGFFVPDETVEGGPGIIVLKRHGKRILKNLQWGFPRQTREMRDQGEGPGKIGLVADLTNPMWQDLVVDPRYRCLIALTHFANPDGVSGGRTRTWFSLKDATIFAWAGFCRNTAEFGPVYAGMTMEANALIPPTNDRMPVLLDPTEYDRWLHGSIEDVIAFMFGPPFPADRMKAEPTDDLWRSGEPPPATAAQLGLF